MINWFLLSTLVKPYPKYWGRECLEGSSIIYQNTIWKKKITLHYILTVWSQKSHLTSLASLFLCKTEIKKPSLPQSKWLFWRSLRSCVALHLWPNETVSLLSTFMNKNTKSSFNKNNNNSSPCSKPLDMYYSFSPQPNPMK